MKNSGNPMGTNVINNLTALKFFSRATAIQKNLCLASCSSHLFLERKELSEVPFILKKRFFYFLLLFLLVFTGTVTLNAQNSTWKLVKNEDSIQVYSRKPNNSKLRIIKVSTLVRTSLSSLVELIKDAPDNKKWVYLNKKAEILEEKNPFSWIMYSQTDAPWPISDRDVVVRGYLSQDSITKIVSITAVALPRYIPKKKDYVRIPFAVSKWYFIPKKGGLVEAEYTLEVDVGGKIPRWLANMAATKGPFQTMRGLRKEIKRKKYRKVHLSFIMEPK